MKLHSILLSVFALTFILSSCNPDDPEPVDLPKFPITINIDHVFGDNDLVINGNFDTTANGDSFQLTKLIYHINTFTFYNAAGTAILEDPSYFMVDLENPESFKFELSEIPEEADSVSFYIGVADSAVNANGELATLFTDPMFWGMINGYINVKLEGNSPNVDNGAVVLHVGGYLGATKNYKKIGLSLSSSRPKSVLGSNTVNLQWDLANYFHGPNLIDLSVTNLIHNPVGDAQLIAENWHDIMSFTGSN